MNDAIGPPADVPCAGCGRPTPYRAGEGSEFPSYGEALNTPLGMTYVKTHRARACVEAARERLDGAKRRYKTVEQDLAELRRQRAGSSVQQDE